MILVFYHLPVMGSMGTALIGGKLDLLNRSTNTCRAELMVPPTWPCHISIIRHRLCSNRWKIKHKKTVLCTSHFF